MYSHITYTERCIINRFKQDGHSLRYIALILARDVSSISRELKRNKNSQGYYAVRTAQEKANGRKSRSRKKKMFTRKDWVKVEFYLKAYWSPEQISLYLGFKGTLDVSHQTIYDHIRRNKKKGGKLWKYLRQSGKIRRKGYGRPDSRGKLQGKKGLEERPDGANSRKEKGHFEIDLVHGNGSTDCILTLVDRKTRFTMIRKLPNKTMAVVSEALIYICNSFKIKSLTADNGTEWHDYKRVEEETGVPFYFAKPYHSWERGTNENTNGLIRQFSPKKASMKFLTQKECDKIANLLNRRPRKILNLITPEMSHFGVDTMLHFKV